MTAARCQDLDHLGANPALQPLHPGRGHADHPAPQPQPCLRASRHGAPCGRRAVRASGRRCRVCCGGAAVGLPCSIGRRRGPGSAPRERPRGRARAAARQRSGAAGGSAAVRPRSAAGGRARRGCGQRVARVGLVAARWAARGRPGPAVGQDPRPSGPLRPVGPRSRRRRGERAPDARALAHRRGGTLGRARATHWWRHQGRRVGPRCLRC